MFLVGEAATLMGKVYTPCMYTPCIDPVYYLYTPSLGSILGPLLFLLYINDLQHVFVNTYFKFYADDTVLYAMDRDELVAHGLLQKDLDAVTNWCNGNGFWNTSFGRKS